MSNALQYRMPQGVPGDISRAFGQATVESQAFNPLLPFAAFGWPGKMVGGLFVPLALVGDTAPYGWLVRPFPTTGLNASDPLGAAVPKCTAGRQADVLVRGYMTVFCQAGSPVAGGQVYVRYASPSGAAVIGGIEAAAIGATTVALTGVTFYTAADAAGNCEIRVNI